MSCCIRAGKVSYIVSLKINIQGKQKGQTKNAHSYDSVSEGTCLSARILCNYFSKVERVIRLRSGQPRNLGDIYLLQNVESGSGPLPVSYSLGTEG